MSVGDNFFTIQAKWIANILQVMIEAIAIPMAAIKILTAAGQIEAQADINAIRAQFPEVPLDPAVLADLVERNIAPMEWAAKEALKSSIDGDNFAKMVLVTGEPPGLMQMLNLWRRDLLDTPELERMIAYSRVRTEWTEYIELLAHDTMSQGEALEAAVKGVLTPEVAKDLFEKAGGLPEQFQTLLDTSGNAIGIQEVEKLWLHGNATSEDVHRVILHSRVNPMFEELASKLYHHYLTGFQIRTIVADGGATPEQATQWLIEEGYPPDQAASFVKAVAHGSAKKVHDISEAQILELYQSHFIGAEEAKTMLTHLGYPDSVQTYLLEILDARRSLAALNQGVTYVRKAYLAGRINENQAQTELGALEVPNHAITAYLAAWKVEKASEFKTLTWAQIGAAFKKGFITQEDALARYKAMGYDDADAAISLAEHGGPPPAGSPAATGGK